MTAAVTMRMARSQYHVRWTSGGSDGSGREARSLAAIGWAMVCMLAEEDAGWWFSGMGSCACTM